MTQIPSDISASAAQVGFQANEVAKQKEARQSGQAETAQRQIRSVDDAETTVDTQDSDVAVFSDAEGRGGQGRRSEDNEEQESPDDVEGSQQGIVHGEDGKLHVDLEA